MHLIEPLAPNERIWQIVFQIPAGRVASYGQIAALAGLPGHARQVGAVLKSLPKPTTLPWHRVCNAQGRLSLPEGSTSYREQKARLESEGIVFVKGRIALDRYRWELSAEAS